MSVPRTPQRMASTGPTTESQLRRQQEQQSLQRQLAQQNRNNMESGIYNQIARLNAAMDVSRMQHQVAMERIRQQRTEVPSGYMNAVRLLGY